MKKRIVMAGLFLGIGAAAYFSGNGQQIEYPETKRVDTTDVYFGTEVADPYRWLEDDNSEETAAWVEAQNKVTHGYLAQIPFREALKEKLTGLVNYEKMGIPSFRKGKYYFFRNDGLQNQSVLYETDDLNGEAKVLLDPNSLSDDGTVALSGISFSKDGKYLAYVISRSGSDWNEIYVMDVASRKVLDDHIMWAKFTDATWCGDGFYYSAYDAPADGKGLSAKNEFQKVYYHKIGTPQSEDRLEYMNPEHPLRFYSVTITDDERFLCLYESDGEGNAIYVKDLNAVKPEYVCIASDMAKNNFVIDSDEKRIYMLTNEDAPNYKLLAFVVSAVFAGVAGVLYSFKYSTVSASGFDYNYSIEILIMVVLGGMGNISGAMISATLITFINVKLQTLLTGPYAILKDVIYAIILVLIVIYNNAPKLKGFREKYNLKALFAKITSNKKRRGYADDDGAWHRVPTKIEMNEVLSTDLIVNESVKNPDKEDKS